MKKCVSCNEKWDIGYKFCRYCGYSPPHPSISILKEKLANIGITHPSQIRKVYLTKEENEIQFSYFELKHHGDYFLDDTGPETDIHEGELFNFITHRISEGHSLIIWPENANFYNYYEFDPFLSHTKTINKNKDPDEIVNFNGSDVFQSEVYLNFKKQLELARKNREIEDNCPVFLKTFDILPIEEKSLAFFELIDANKSSELLNKYYSQLITLFFVLLKSIDKISPYHAFKAYSSLLKVAKETGRLEEHFPAFLGVIDKLHEYKYSAFSDLLEVTKEMGLIKDHFIAFLESIEKLSCFNKYEAFSTLLRVAEERGWIEEHYHAFLGVIDKLFERYEVGVKAFKSLLEVVKDKELIDEYFSAFLETIDKYESDKYIAFSVLLKVAKETRRLKEHFSAFSEAIDKLPDYGKYYAFSDLLKVAKETGRLKEHFSALLGVIDKLFEMYEDGVDDEFGEWGDEEQADDDGVKAFKSLLEVVKDKDLIDEFFPAFLETIEKLHDHQKCDVIAVLFEVTKEKGWQDEYLSAILKSIKKIEDEYKYEAFSTLLRAAGKKGWIEEHFSTFLGVIDKFPNPQKYKTFSTLINGLKSTEVLNKFFSQIETTFLAMLKVIEKLPILAFSALLKITKETGRLKEHFPAFLEAIEKLPDYDKYSAFSDLFKVLKETGRLEEHFPAFLETMYKLPDYDMYSAFSDLLKVSKETGRLEEHFPAFLGVIDKLFKRYENGVDDEFGEWEDEEQSDGVKAFRSLLEVVKDKDLIDEYFPAFLETMYKLPDYDNYSAFSDLLKVSKETGRLEEHFPAFLGTIDKLPDYGKYRAFSDLLKVLKETGRLEEHLPALLGVIDKLFKMYEDGVLAFKSLLEVVKDKDLIDEYFPAFLGTIDKLPDYGKYRAFSDLLKISKETGHLEEHFPAFLEAIDKLSYYDKYYAFSDLFKVSKEAGLLEEHLPAFLGVIDMRENIKYIIFHDLIKAIKNTKLLSEHYSRIKTLFIALIDSFDKLAARKNDYYSFLNAAIKDTDLEDESIYKKWKQLNLEYEK